MKIQPLLFFVSLCLFHLARSQRPRVLGFNRRYPNKPESEVCGRIRDLIPRGSGRFRKILVRNTNDQAYYANEDCRRMTSRTKSKLDILASRVIAEWGRQLRVRVLQAWTDQISSQDRTSLHYEGRSVRLQLSNQDRSKLGRLAGIAIEAGFDWVEYTNTNYIRASVIPDVCQTSVDIAFLLDGSGSIGPTNFNKVKQFVKKVVDFFNIGVSGTHVAVARYESNTHIQFNLKTYYTKLDMQKAVDRLSYQGGGTHTGEAIEVMTRNIFTAYAGMRTDPGIPKVLVLLTDGESYGKAVYGPAKVLKDTGVTIFSIGVGGARLQELNDISSDPDKDYVRFLNNFSDLSGFVDRLSAVSCNEGSVINSCDNAETTVESGSFKYFRTQFEFATGNQVSVEVRDIQGISHLYASATSRNPGPLDLTSVKNEQDRSPRAVSVGLSGTQTVYVAVQGQKDVNKFSLSFWDNLFAKATYTKSIKEGKPAQPLSGVLNLATNKYRLVYRITDGNNGSAFRIDDRGPRIYTTKVLDRELISRYNLVIVAENTENKCHKSRTLVQVDVEDVNDNRPKFTENPYRADVYENAQSGMIIKTVKAMDSDYGNNGLITYSIVPSANPGNLFLINDLGQVTLQGKLDYETTTAYTLKIEARDRGTPSLNAFTNLEIKVLNVNEAPRISCVGSCSMRVVENANSGTSVGQIQASDPDTKARCALSYVISSNAKDKFAVASDGKIKTKVPLNREVAPQYVFSVTVRDCGSPVLTDSVKVTVIVEDLNDNDPKFSGPYTVNVLESLARGSNIVQVRATDADEGNNAVVRYSLSGSDSSAFQINAVDGRVTSKQSLDYETKRSYRFTVTATDQGAGSRTGSTTISVNVVDVNDNSPVFTGAPYTASVYENTAEGTQVKTIQATDRDSGANGQVRYGIVDGNIGNAFTINAGSGLITVNSKLDRETRSSYNLLVQASDRGSPSRYSRATIKISIQDRNDNSPVFHGLPYTQPVSENVPVNQRILKVSATDRDAGVYGQVTYSIGSPDNQIFSVDSSGNILLKKKLDYETKQDYTFKVVATDGGGLNAEATVKVVVEDYNDNAPVFDENPYAASIAENALVGDVVKTVNAEDQDSGVRGRVTYSITNGNTNNAFRVSSAGVVTVASILDRETRDSYTLTITARDDGSPSLSSTTKLKITITDINDNRPAFSRSSFSFNITENNSPGAAAGSTGPATDADIGKNGEVVYTILSGNTNGAFEFLSTGVVNAKRSLDREAISSYKLVIEARDKGSPALFTRVPVEVTVVDQNDNVPVFSQLSYTCRISENSAKNSPVCFVRASDRDAGVNGVVVYELVSAISQFSIDQNNGEIQTKVTLDREVKSSYTFEVRAKDGASPSLSSKVTVTVQVIDKNDNDPVFNQSAYAFSVSEDAGVKTRVGSVFAEDKDEGANGQVVYSITGGNTKNAFDIDRDSGKISVKSLLDRETLATYKLTVKAADRGSPTRSSSRVVTINVKDVNDNDPKFTQTLYTGSIAEDASIDSGVVQVKATDQDEGVNGQIKYSITGGEKKEHFRIDANTGFVRTAATLDYETKKSYELDVKATDGGAPSRWSTSRVIITVKNTNDNAPTFVPGSPIASVSEAVAVGTEVVKFNATDKDGNKLKFSISSGNTDNTLKINADTGVLKTAKKLDRETVARYNLTVTVTESGTGGQSSSQNLSVIVLDENDNAPVFNPGSYEVNVTENDAAGQIVTVKATDKDEGNNSKISFEIDLTSKFVIDPTTGVISTKAALDHEESPRYVIRVTAKDAGRPSLSSVTTVKVLVMDTNDNNPNFESDYSTSLPENTASGRRVLRVEATDADSGINGEVKYSITNGNNAGFFSLDSNDGSIAVARSPDREANPSFTLTILASNQVPFTNSASQAKTTATVKITITDVNDNAPIITNKVDAVQVHENSILTTEVFDVDATDQDAGVNGHIQYEIVSGNVRDAFAVDLGTGKVTVKGAIDREVLDSYTLKIRASDKGTPSMFSEKDFTVTVTDVDDNKPVFIGAPYVAPISEAASVTSSVIQIKATDKDIGANGKITFSLTSGNDLGHFRINSTSGEILTNAALDYEKVREYALVVTARDTKHSVQANLRITVVNINDNKPVFNPTRYIISIPEDTKLDKEFLTLKATDLDPFSGLVFTIGSGNQGSKFTLDPSNGKLSVAAALDRETTDFYNLSVRVTDGGTLPLSNLGVVEVTITDVNDNAPKFNSSLERASVTENSRVGAVILNVNATDLDLGVNADLRYNITKGNDKRKFKINSRTGALSVNGNIDRETTSSFVLEIVAQDQGTPSLTSQPLRVEIIVLDENDNDPMFQPSVYRLNITENLSAGTFVEEVEATDKDLEGNGEVVYSIKSGHSGHFTIEKNTGIVKTTVPLDRENISSYTIIIEARDGGNPSRSSTAALYVNVVDVNDNAPAFIVSSLRGNVTEERPKGEFVARVVATDPDLGRNAQIQYKLTIRGDQSLEMDSDTGVVRTRVKFDFEQRRNYTFKVIASDKGNPSLSTTGELVINVLDIDDNCAVFNPKEYNVTIQENKPLAETIVRVYATDIDTVNEENLDYGIRSGNLANTFRIHPNAGNITSNKFVDREISDEYNLIVRAGSDYCGVNSTEDEDESSHQELSKSIAYVNIFVTDVNDNAPVFLKNPYKYQLSDIYENDLLWVNATDPDSGVNAEVDFALDSVERDGSQRTLTVKAIDRGTPTLSSNTSVVVTGERCEAMLFSVSSRGHVTVQTLCVVEKYFEGSALVGESIRLNCSAKGNTIPEYRWIRDGVPVTDWQKTGEYSITSLTKEDAGEYTCMASSVAGNVLSEKVDLSVKEPARITKHPKDTWVEIGKRGVLSCNATGDKPISYTWYKNGKRLLSTTDLETKKADLVFDRVIEEDAADYYCMASNNVGDGAAKSKTARLQVYTPDSVVEMDLTVDKPRQKESCQFFNMTNVEDALEEIMEGEVAIVEFSKPREICNLTACSSDPCQNQATCLVQGSGFICQCPRGWSGKLCENDINECQTEKCKNNGTCQNKKGSFSCDCVKGSSGKFCQHTEAVCSRKPCGQGKKCYPKDSSAAVYECINDPPKTVDMEFKLDESRRPFEDWMKYDISRDIENAIKRKRDAAVNRGSQGKRRRRSTQIPDDYSDCSVRINNLKARETAVELQVVLVCAKSPSKTFVCEALLNEGKVASCAGDNDVITEEQPTEPPTMAPVRLTVVFIARSPSGKETRASEAIATLKEGEIERKLGKYGVTDIELRARSAQLAKKESGSKFTSGAIAGVSLGIAVVIVLAIVAVFLVHRTRRRGGKQVSIGGRAILSRTPSTDRILKHDIDMKELKHADARGVNNKTFSEIYDEPEGNPKDLEDGTFMVENPQLALKKDNLQYMAELESAPWFHGSISRSKAEDILDGKDEEGTFLVRAGLDEGELYISVRAAGDGPKCRHMPVNRRGDGFVAVCGPKSEAMNFPTFRDMINYLKFNATHFGVGDDMTLKDYVEKN